MAIRILQYFLLAPSHANNLAPVRELHSVAGLGLSPLVWLSRTLLVSFIRPVVMFIGIKLVGRMCIYSDAAPLSMILVSLGFDAPLSQT
jgi:hypothetical protein